ncbi:MAG: hypothetical protein VW268_12840 [Rhodospirillaceae bacterium]
MTGYDGVMKFSLIVPLFIGAVTLAGCSATAWEKPGVQPDQLDYDRQACRSIARKEADRQLRRQPIPGETRGNIIGGDYDAAIAQYEMIRDADRMFISCMEGRGYRRTSKPLF